MSVAQNLNDGFNVRVYGILFSRDRSNVLLMEEQIMGRNLRKFPGGGLEKGEGPHEALVREFQEELCLAVVPGEPYYISPHFHVSFFRPQQVIGLYWEVSTLDPSEPTLTTIHSHLKPFWQPLSQWDIAELTHPMDREVAVAILANCSKN